MRYKIKVEYQKNNIAYVLYYRGLGNTVEEAISSVTTAATRYINRLGGTLISVTQDS